ncbi:rhombotarget lipoprotein [Pseudoalteromonas sp. CR1]|uniref:rhombotarget lipoprotein n=1 Tax=Pseudoalteromonas sp. CR1 TaxID=2861964 RepID=UPI001C5F33A7|nr:rhombotarget lipoprotein [Pseudoalteromonas sp. CR1]MBW4965467.1 rhombotarget lipoprotein [Pseudoalteromonas sp. CR1]
MKKNTFFVMLMVFLLTSCSALVSNHSNKNTRSSSLVDFLYPNKDSRAAYKPEIPVLKLPVTVGISFVPSKEWRANGIESQNEVALLEKVKKSFLQYDYIDRIEVIPSTYLKGGEGFSALEQVGRLYDVDVMALVSYDQVTQTYENNAALLYWTIVGMYVIPGNENTIQTFVDTAVFDIKSKKMLFRAPGISKLEKRTTAIGIDETLNEKSLEGFNLAVIDMSLNLDAELARFKTRVKEEKIAKIENKDGSSSAGAFSVFFMFLTSLLVLKRRNINS